MDWPGRRTQGATDPLNSALNYGYGILYGAVERACVLAGLDPYAGFLHVDRPGKPSLVLDLIEEFRQPVVDKTVLGMVNKGMPVTLDEQGRLVPESRRLLAEKVLARLDSPERFRRQALRADQHHPDAGPPRGHLRARPAGRLRAIRDELVIDNR